jgi:hypothetical protein
MRINARVAIKRGLNAGAGYGVRRAVAQVVPHLRILQKGSQNVPPHQSPRHVPQLCL